MTAPVQGAPQQVTNYLIPSSGGTMAVPFLGTFSATPFSIDWRQFTIDQEPFIPQGAFIDNTQGTGTLSITILGINWTVNVPAGDQAQVQFPAPTGMQMSITGNGFANIQFVNFPVLPSGQQVTVTGTVNVDVVGPNPLPVSAPINVAGVPYQVNIEPTPLLTLVTAQIVSGSNTGTIAIPAGATFLRKLRVTICGNTALAAAAALNIAVTANGVAVFFDNAYVPAAAGATVPGVQYSATLDFAEAAPAVAGGNLVVTCGTNLTSGAINAVGYFE